MPSDVKQQLNGYLAKHRSRKPVVICGLMGFYSDLMGFFSDLMGFYSDLMGY